MNRASPAFVVIRETAALCTPGRSGQSHAMPRRGPLPLEAHAMTEPVIGLLFILAPSILGFDDGSARTLSIIVGVVILIGGMTTRWRLSLVKLIPLRVHTSPERGRVRAAANRSPAEGMPA